MQILLKCNKENHEKVKNVLTAEDLSPINMYAFDNDSLQYERCWNFAFGIYPYALPLPFEIEIPDL